uniref:BTB domain-containing protein n=1 Tax=Strongyloides papillosus TaxID=174720 RepID=A0A0N5BZT7_STREA
MKSSYKSGDMLNFVTNYDIYFIKNNVEDREYSINDSMWWSTHDEKQKKWFIENFESLLTLKNGEFCLKSSELKDVIFPNVTFQLHLYPCKNSIYVKTKIFLYLYMKSSYKSGDMLNFVTNYDIYFIKNNVEDREYGINDRSFDKNIVKNILQSDDSLIIGCDIKLIQHQDPIFRDEIPIDFYMEMECVDRKYISHISDMYERGDLSDYKIICEDREFLVHKFILASQSPVFMDIFKSSPGKKEIEDVIKIADSKQEFVEKMIEYIYCGNLGKDLSVDESIGLLHLAHKYDIESLKLLCERELVDKLNNENVHMLAEISEKYQALNLKKVLFEEYVFNILIICYMSNFLQI